MPTHSETRRLPYTAQQMYDLVADVARYPEFLPWTAAARIREVTRRGRSSGDAGRPGDFVQGVPRTLRQPRHAVARERNGSTPSIWTGRSAT